MPAENLEAANEQLLRFSVGSPPGLIGALDWLAADWLVSVFPKRTWVRASATRRST